MARSQPSSDSPAGIESTGWRIGGVSVEGYRHRRAGESCQDAWAQYNERAPTVLAVADGAGTRARSGEGARLAADLAVRHFGPALAERHPELLAWRPGERVEPIRDVMRSSFRRLHEEFHTELRLTAGPSMVAEFATTLTVVVLLPALLCQIAVGDGFVLVRAGAERPEAGSLERQVHLLPQMESASEYGNETVFVTSPDVQRRVRVDCLADPAVDGVLLSTDGFAPVILGDAAGWHGGVNHPLANRLFDQMDRGDDQGPVARLLRSNQVARANGDDMTVVRAVRG